MKKFVFLHLFLLILASGCQIRLFPELTPARKFTTSFAAPVLEKSCEVPPVTVYFAGALVSDPFQGKRVVVESDDGELLFVKSVEWGGRFEDLFGRSFEDGLRTAFSEFPAVQVLSPESGAESNFDLGIHVTQHRLREVQEENTKSKVIESTAVLRISGGITHGEQYYILSAETTLNDAAEYSCIEAIRENVRSVSIEAYRKTINYLCSFDSDTDQKNSF